jgi:hypothetical protein
MIGSTWWAMKPVCGEVVVDSVFQLYVTGLICIRAARPDEAVSELKFVFNRASDEQEWWSD